MGADKDHDIECGINPSLHRLANGTWILATRYGSPQGRSHLALASSSTSWKGPYTVISAGTGPGSWAPGVATSGSEDPFVWKNQRGFHMLHHDGPHGRHV